MDYRLIYKKSNNSQLVGFTDSDYASDIEDRKSTSGYIFMYGDCVISWNSSKQKTVSLSSTEAEYIGFAEAAKEGMWLHTILEELERAVDVVQILCDNKSTIRSNKSSRTTYVNENRLHYSSIFAVKLSLSKLI
jgi:hypothetical protein